VTNAPIMRSVVGLVAWLAGASVPAFAEEASPTLENLNPLHGLAKDALSAFRDRPLFNPARAEPRASAVAPAAVIAPPPEPPPEPPPAIRLVGIVSGSRNLAVVRPASGGKTSVVATGDKLGAWTATVSATNLTLQADARSVEFGLFQRAGAPDPGRTEPAGVPLAPKGADAFPPTGDPLP
jgi:hypothetical protein